MKKRKIIPYNPRLKELAKKLRNNSTKSEIILWLKLKNKQLYNYKFIRQKPDAVAQLLRNWLTDEWE